MGTYSQLLQKPQPAIEEQEPVASSRTRNKQAEPPAIAGNIAIQQASNMDSNISDNIASNIAILQLRAEDIAALDKALTNRRHFALPNRDGWLREMAYQLSKDLPRGKVNQDAAAHRPASGAQAPGDEQRRPDPHPGGNEVARIACNIACNMQAICQQYGLPYSKLASNIAKYPLTPSHFHDDCGAQRICFELDPTAAGHGPRPTVASPEPSVATAPG